MFKDAPAGASVFSGYRSPALQAQLFARSDRSGHMVAPPGRSHHGKGDAADIKGDLPWFHKHAAEYGLRFPMPYENWHIQADPNTKVPVPAWHDHVEPGSARKRFLPHREHVSVLGQGRLYPSPRGDAARKEAVAKLHEQGLSQRQIAAAAGAITSMVPMRNQGWLILA
jgi:hypothetical protein